MDLDDIEDVIEDLIPKKQLKKLKKQVKKKSLLQTLFAAFVAIVARIFGGQSSSEAPPAKQAPRRSPQSQSAAKKAKRNPYAEQLAEAHAYRDRISEMARSAKSGSVEQMRLTSLSERVTEWTQTMESIVERIVSSQDDALIAKDRERVPKAIRRLEKQLDDADDAQVRTKLEQTLANRRAQLKQMEQANNQRQIAALKLENMLAQLGTLYAQLHSGRMLSERSGYERLSAELSDQVNELEDYLDALDELNRTSA